MLACHVSILHDARGPNNSITEGDAASLLAMGEAFRILGRDQADFFLVGGAESKINPLSLVRQCLYEPLSHRNDAPEKACRPFDRNRDGLVVGEGAGVFVLEELEHAKQRGARIYAEVVGFRRGVQPGPQGRRPGAGRAGRPEGGGDRPGGGRSRQRPRPGVARHRTSGRREICKSVFGVEQHAGGRGEELHWQPGRGRQYDGVGGERPGPASGVVPRTLNYDEPDPDCPVNVTTVSPADDAAVRGQSQLHPDGSVCGRGPSQVGVKDNVQCSVFSVQQRPAEH